MLKLGEKDCIKKCQSATILLLIAKLEKHCWKQKLVVLKIRVETLQQAL